MGNRWPAVAGLSAALLAHPIYLAEKRLMYA